MQNISRRAIFAVAIVAAFPVLAHNECRLTFSGYEGKETLRDFPALVKIPDGLTGFDYKESTAEYIEIDGRKVVSKRGGNSKFEIS